MPRETQAASSRPTLPIWKKAVFSLLTVTLLFLLIELILALAGVRPSRVWQDPYFGFSSKMPLFVETRSEDGRLQMVRARNKERFFNEQRFDRKKPANTYRIVCLGGSTTYGRPYDDGTSFCGFLRELLPAIDSSRRWEVINAGGISYASYRVALIAEELAAHQPDLFIVYTGHNEFLEKRTYTDVIEAPAPIRGLRAALSRTRLYTFLGRLTGRGPQTPQDASKMLPAEVDAILDRSVGPADYSRDDDLHRGVLAHFRLNLARIVDIARSAGAEVMLIRPTSNLLDCTPFKSEYSESTPPEVRTRLETLRSAWKEDHDAERFDEALAHCGEALPLDGRHAHLHWERGRTLHALGRSDEAIAALRRARDEDVCPLRAPSDFEETVPEVAEKRGTLSVDFRRVLLDAGARDPLGADSFLDHVHPTIEAHATLAVAILESLAQAGILPPRESWTDDAIDAARRRVQDRIDPQAQASALKNLAKVLGWAGKFEEARALAERSLALEPRDAEAHFHHGVTLERGGDLDGARRSYERALANAPNYSEASLRLGQLSERAGDLVGAEARYVDVLRHSPRNAKVLTRLGTVLARLDKHREAVARLRSALDVDPKLLAAKLQLGFCLVELGEHAAAERELVQALAVDDRNVSALVNLGLALLGQGRPEAAEARYREAIAIDPDHVLAHDNLGNLLAETGRIEPAIREFGEVLRLVPQHEEVPAKLAVMLRRFEGVIRVQPDELDAHLYRALALATLGRREAATRACEDGLVRCRAGLTSPWCARLEELRAQLSDSAAPAGAQR